MKTASKWCSARAGGGGEPSCAAAVARCGTHACALVQGAPALRTFAAPAPAAISLPFVSALLRCFAPLLFSPLLVPAASIPSVCSALSALCCCMCRLPCVRLFELFAHCNSCTWHAACPVSWLGQESCTAHSTTGTLSPAQRQLVHLPCCPAWPKPVGGWARAGAPHGSRR